MSADHSLVERQRMRFCSVLVASLLVLGNGAALATDDGDALRPVSTVASGRIQLTTDRGTGVLPVDVSRDWSATEPSVVRAIVMVPGLSRRGLFDGTFAQQNARDFGRDAIVITPQFLIQADVDANNLPSEILRWGPEDWKAGYAALSPARISSFSAVDAILARLADRRLFPNLQTVVVAGHSAGGQFVQRYAVVGRGPQQLLDLGIKVRYVVANPSSYLYFSSDRPALSNDKTATTEVDCPKMNLWQYGLGGHFPGYVTQPVDARELEDHYVKRDVTYLLGTADTDPNHPELDRSCAGEAEGANRFARGTAFYAYLAARHADLSQRLLEAPGIGHDGRQMFSSACGLAALFDKPGCTATPVEAIKPIHKTSYDEGVRAIVG